jgi:aminopeptidase YwaD
MERNRTTAIADTGEAASLFDPSSAVAFVRELCATAGGRRVVSPQHELARDLLVARFEALGLDVEVQAFPLPDIADLVETPQLSVAGLEHRADYAEHPRSAYQPDPLTGRVTRPGAADVRDGWVALDAVPQGEGLDQLAADLAARGAHGLLTPQFRDASGYLTKRLVGGSVVGLPILAVAADVLPTLIGEQVTVSVPLRRISGEGHNVLATLPGSVPALSSAPVLLTAHYDGVGDDPDRSLPAAGDNASGVAVVLELAKTLARSGTPRARTVVFAALDAEEVGAEGSHSHAHALRAQGIYPTVVNLDMVARWHGAVSVELGPGSESVRAALDRVGKAHGIPLILGAIASDNRRYAAAGFPAVGLGTGAAGYHSPADSPDLVELEAIERTGKLVLGVVDEITKEGTTLS